MAKKLNNEQLSLGWREFAKKVGDTSLSHERFKKALKDFNIPTKVKDLNAYAENGLIIVEEKMTHLHPQMMRKDSREKLINSYLATAPTSVPEKKEKKIDEGKLLKAMELLESAGYNFICRDEVEASSLLERKGFRVLSNEDAYQVALNTAKITRILLAKNVVNIDDLV